MVIGATAVEVKALPSVAEVTVEPEAEKSREGVGEGTALTSAETAKTDASVNPSIPLQKELFFVIRFPQIELDLILENQSIWCLMNPKISLSHPHLLPKTA